ncbi:ribonuclease H-like domain-containing protein, partial [Tanacetum coccineum]
DHDPVTLISKLDISDPLHLHPNDTTALTVVSIKLKGTKNYQVWSCAMLLALEGKNKTGFIDGTCKRSNTDEVPDEQMATFISLIKDNKNGKNVQANMAGANQHMTYTDKKLDNIHDISHLKIKVGHPNGTKAFIYKIGNLKLSNGLTLYGVLVIPKYCVTLISVHKLAKENKVVVAFDENKCYFLNQDLSLRSIMETRNQYHRILLVDQILTFYHGITMIDREKIMMAAGGNIVCKTPQEAYDLIENMTLYHFQWDVELYYDTTTGVGAHYSDPTSLLSAQIEVLGKQIAYTSQNLQHQPGPGHPHTVYYSESDKSDGGEEP